MDAKDYIKTNTPNFFQSVVKQDLIEEMTILLESYHQHKLTEQQTLDRDKVMGLLIEAERYGVPYGITADAICSLSLPTLSKEEIEKVGNKIIEAISSEYRGAVESDEQYGLGEIIDTIKAAIKELTKKEQ
jgi:hypothetical protein